MDEAGKTVGIEYVVPVLAGLGREGVMQELPALLQARRTGTCHVNYGGYVGLNGERGLLSNDAALTFQIKNAIVWSPS